MQVLEVHLPGLGPLVERLVEEKLAQWSNDLGRSAAPTNPWLDSKASAEYLGVTRQRIHDLVNTGRLPRHGEKGHRLFFRQAELDAYRAGGAS